MEDRNAIRTMIRKALRDAMKMWDIRASGLGGALLEARPHPIINEDAEMERCSGSTKKAGLADAGPAAFPVPKP
jgi:hypothetical protein